VKRNDDSPRQPESHHGGRLRPILSLQLVETYSRPARPLCCATSCVRFKVIKVFDGTDTGFTGLFYKNDTQNEIVLAISAMDAEGPPDTAQALKSAWLMWNNGKEEVLGAIKTLKDSDTGWAFDAATTQVNFAGQSLGGALAGYAAFDFWRDNKVNNPDIVSRITLTTFDGLAGVAEMAALGDATVPLRSASQ